MSTKKTIQINPDFFKISGKTKKNREKKELSLAPFIKEDNLKNKLLNRIKQHKNKEIKTNKQIAEIDDGDPTDEFNDAIHFLKKQKIKTNLFNKTIKQPSNQSNVNLDVAIGLPPELTFSASQQSPIKLSYKTDNDIPYGCLKGGHKKTYREWRELTSSKDATDIVRPPTPPKKHDKEPDENPREQRLQQIKLKLKKMHDDETQLKMESFDKFKELESRLNLNGVNNNELNDNYEEQISRLIEEKNKKDEEKPKKYIKKTTKQKFTLGRSKNMRRVSVLIKNKQTRKNILNAQRELKKTDISDVRKYLRQHGMIKVGSTCPPDILRQTYENAMMTGEVRNTNKDTLLHNFMAGV
jgi:hypothetical protein